MFWNFFQAPNMQIRDSGEGVSILVATYHTVDGRNPAPLGM